MDVIFKLNSYVNYDHLMHIGYVDLSCQFILLLFYLSCFPSFPSEFLDISQIEQKTLCSAYIGAKRLKPYNPYNNMQHATILQFSCSPNNAAPRVVDFLIRFSVTVD